MSAWIDNLVGDSYTTSNGDVGPQDNGTNLASDVSYPAQPADTGGGAPFNYEQAVLDVFKVGVGVWERGNQRKDMFDYKRFETTAAGTWQQGRGAVLPKTATGQAMSGTTLLIIAGVVIFALSSSKG